MMLYRSHRPPFGYGYERCTPYPGTGTKFLQKSHCRVRVWKSYRTHKTVGYLYEVSTELRTCRVRVIPWYLTRVYKKAYPTEHTLAKVLIIIPILLRNTLFIDWGGGYKMPHLLPRFSLVLIEGLRTWVFQLHRKCSEKCTGKYGKFSMYGDNEPLLPLLH